MGESASARTERELLALRGEIDRDVDALLARVREDVDPRNLVRRNPLAVGGSLASVATAAAVGLWRRAREGRRAEAQVDALIARFGGRIDRLKGKARKRFRQQLREEMSEVGTKGLRDVAVEAVTGALTAIATTLAQGLARRLLGDERGRHPH